MKKIIALLSISLLVLVGCQNKSAQSSHKKQVTVTTSFIADITKQLAGNLVDIAIIIPPGEDPHQYVAKTSDLKKLTDTDLVLYHGLHFEGKFVEALELVGKPITKDFPTDQLLTLDTNDQVVSDPHFWFDIALYKLAVQNVSIYLQKLLPDHIDLITTNTANYLKQLDDLDTYIKTQLESIPVNSRYLITPHDAFNYFAKRYNIIVSAPQGINTSSEVSNTAMIETVNLIIDHQIKAVFSESTTNPDRMRKLQEAVRARGSDVKVVTGDDQELFSDSLAPSGQFGDTYIDMYKHNIDLIVNNLK